MNVPTVSIQLETLPAEQFIAGWLILGVFEGNDPGSAFREIDLATQGLLTTLREGGDHLGKRNELVPIYHPRGLGSARLILMGLGKPELIDRAVYQEVGQTAGKFISRKPLTRVGFAFPQVNADALLGIGVGLSQGCIGPGLRKSDPGRYQPSNITFLLPRTTTDLLQYRTLVRRAQAEAQAVALARELVNLPPSDLYPETFAQIARELSSTLGIECVVMDEDQIRTERMGALLAVARGSDRPPRFVVLRIRRGGNAPTLAFVGKGVTFDSGGLSLKSNDQMMDMKSDMAGAAAALAATSAIAELNLPINLLTVLPLVENMPSGKSMKLGDVLHARNRKTIEVMNTDAEGRLILADALSYAADARADHLIDLATLTGACMVALGAEVAGLFGNRDSWSDEVRTAARRAGERVWPMPMDAQFEELLRSHVADLRNSPGNRYGGAIAAAKFLEQFVSGVPWVHLDIAGPAWSESETPHKDVGATGAFVRTLVELAHAYPPK